MIKKFFTQESFWVVSVLMATFAVAVTVAVLPPSIGGGTSNEVRAQNGSNTASSTDSTTSATSTQNGTDSSTEVEVEPPVETPVATSVRTISVRVMAGDTLRLADGDDWPADTPGGPYKVSIRHGSTQYNYRITVLRPASASVSGNTAQTQTIDPAGEIPSVLTDASGKAYSVFTPSAGGEFNGSDFGIEVPQGAVPNGEMIGMVMSSSGSAESEIKLHHRLTLGGEKYEIGVIDSTGGEVSSYRLNQPANVALPLPPNFSGNIGKVSIVVINSDGSLTELRSRIRFTDSGGQVVATLSSFPAVVAVGVSGAPEPSPTPVPPPTAEPPKLPPTGGSAPSNQIVWLVLIVGMGISAIGGTMIWRRRKESPYSSRIS